ncbi:MAG: DMT family transporter [Candidatus Eisenbacteria bacterium]|nr:DMT family transporter [Candidatus Eisenbacteria bacterium]
MLRGSLAIETVPERNDRLNSWPLVVYLDIFIAICAVSWAAPLIRLADAPSLAIAFFRMMFASLLLLVPTLVKERSTLISLKSRDWLILLASGFFLALHFAAWISSLAFTSVASSVVILATQPVFAALLGFLILKDKIALMSVWGMAFAIAGSVAIGAGDFSGGARLLFGDLLSLSGAAFVSGYLLIGRSLRKSMPLLAYVFPVYLFAALILGLICFVTRTRLGPFPAQTWAYIFLLALIPQVVGHTLFNWALKHIRAYVVAVAALGEPIGASILAALLFHEIPGPVIYLGGMLILVGIFLVGIFLVVYKE